MYLLTVPQRARLAGVARCCNALCRSAHVRHMPYSANNFSTVTYEEGHIAGGSVLDVMPGADTETATLAWLVSALEQARREGQSKTVAYLEDVADDVVFEMESAARRKRFG